LAAAAIVLGATSMRDVAVLAHLARCWAARRAAPTIRRALDMAGMLALLDRIARARARAQVWILILDTPAGSRGWR
jgi:hypothetical protein